MPYALARSDKQLEQATFSDDYRNNTVSKLPSLELVTIMVNFPAPRHHWRTWFLSPFWRNAADSSPQSSQNSSTWLSVRAFSHHGSGSAQVTPFPKKPSLSITDPVSYRPISNLNTTSKVLERLHLAWLVPHVAPSFAISSLHARSFIQRRRHSWRSSTICSSL